MSSLLSPVSHILGFLISPTDQDDGIEAEALPAVTVEPELRANDIVWVRRNEQDTDYLIGQVIAPRVNDWTWDGRLREGAVVNVIVGQVWGDLADCFVPRVQKWFVSYKNLAAYTAEAEYTA